MQRERGDQVSKLEVLNVGVVGAAGRGRSFRDVFTANKMTRIHAVCDINEERLDEAMHDLGADEKYTCYEEMLEKSDLDAVVIGTPMPLHVPQSIMALERDLHVLSEVPAGVSIEECKALVQACKQSNGVYMMAENYIYMKPNILVRELVRKGLFGEVYYGEGEYLHELKGLNEITKWRRKWQTGIDGITYPTHSLGPVLTWMPGDRVTEVCCAGSGHHYRDPRGDCYEQEDTCVMLARTRKGSLIRIRVDMLSNRPHAMTNYSLQGTRGCYESARSPGEASRIWLADMCEDPNEWMNLAELEDEYLPDMWKNPPEEARRAGHGGGDYFEILDFVNSIVNDEPVPIGIHEAMDMTLPGLVSQQSILENGRWLEVPDSREW